MTKQTVDTIINQAMDAFEEVRQKLSEAIEELHDIEGGETVIKTIEDHASTLVKASNALDDIYSAVEDMA